MSSKHRKGSPRVRRRKGEKVLLSEELGRRDPPQLLDRNLPYNQEIDESTIHVGFDGDGHTPEDFLPPIDNLLLGDMTYDGMVVDTRIEDPMPASSVAPNNFVTAPLPSADQATQQPQRVSHDATSQAHEPHTSMQSMGSQLTHATMARVENERRAFLSRWYDEQDSAKFIGREVPVANSAGVDEAGRCPSGFDDIDHMIPMEQGWWTIHIERYPSGSDIGFDSNEDSDWVYCSFP